MNPFQNLYKKCNTGTNSSKYLEIKPFPDLVDIEVTNTCNFRCRMCPTGNRTLTRSAKFMTREVFYIILRQCAENGAAIRFICWGEPTLHPELLEWIADCEYYGVLSHINTNGSKISKEYAMDLVDAGLNSIKVSFQGTDFDTFLEMRNNKSFYKVIEAVRNLHMARGASRKPFLAVSTSVTYETKEQIKNFVSTFDGIADYVGVGATTFDYLDIDAIKSVREREALRRLKWLSSDNKQHPNPCPEINNKLSIHVNGDVTLCCNDFNGLIKAGNVLDTPMKKIWRSDALEAYRIKLASNDYSMPLCNTCYDYAELTQN